MVITLKIGEQTQKEIAEFYQDMIRENTPPYAIFQAKNDDTVITLYQSGKVVFQGKSADIESQLWKERDKALYPHNVQIEKKEKKKTEKIDNKRYDVDTIGSDEVGTGDFFGPIVVTSVLVNKNDIEFLQELKIKDSKNFNDEEIIKLGPVLMKKLKYQSILLTNQEYNQHYSKDVNMNKIKAILHNKVLILLARDNNYSQVVIDQFTTPKSYFNYLKDAKNVFRNLIFVEKAENKSLPVACASIISRYFFIQKMNELSKEYQINLPYGAASITDEVALQIAKKYSLEELNKLVKLNFKNYQRVLDKIKE